MDKKQTMTYVKTSLILGGIAAGAGLLLACANMITASIIEENTRKARAESVYTIYGDDAVPGEKEITINQGSLISYFPVFDKNESLIGNVFFTKGSNMYGDIEMAVGINEDESIYRIEMINNGQSFAQTLMDNYVIPFNKGERPLTDTSCGATYGANLVKSMAEEAQSYYQNEILGLNIDYNQYLAMISGEGVSFSWQNKINNNNYKLVKSYWTSKLDGVFESTIMLSNKKIGDDMLMLMFNINKNDDLDKMLLIDLTENNVFDSLNEEFIQPFNEGKLDLDDESWQKNQVSKLTLEMANQCLDYYMNNLSDSLVRESYSNVFGNLAFYSKDAKIYEPSEYKGLISSTRVYFQNADFMGDLLYAKYENVDTNEYVRLLVGFNKKGELHKSYIVTNKMNNKDDIFEYINSINDKQMSIDDVVSEDESYYPISLLLKTAKSYYIDELYLRQGKFLNEIIPNASYSKMNEIDYQNLKGYYVASDKNNQTIGYIFYGIVLGTWGTSMEILIGVDIQGNPLKLHLVYNYQSYAEIFQKYYIDNVNSGYLNIEDVKCGATNSAKTTYNLYKSALSFIEKNFN